MAFGPTVQQVHSFASQAFIRKSFKNPFQVASVLSFFFNVDYHDPSHVQSMQSGSTFQEMMPFWYAGGTEYDVLCQKFKDVIRTANQGRLLQQDDDDWHTTVDGKMAQIVLCDQLARNAFRGTEEAFAGDEGAMEIAREMSQELISSTTSSSRPDNSGIILPSLQGIVYPPYLQFIISPLMHSELPNDHDLAVEVADFSVEVAPDHMKQSFQSTKDMELDHKTVIDQFGRYPHRNKKLGRESTAEELEWLSSDDIPDWAKSQA
ncbi:Bacterial protein of unknown function (DUF924) [Seminavis robusta]|uniref:Uncharacterized protein n=1 Tax=Seminavis robusta TaxID=568900 RepID=A0A9N8HUZ2_9STRA|nr:Bacterial protein of unknown function (DUF924) [Seminavis robusta]|eukprot:Sro1902_g304470.1 Bacterial protein of unknown function (DUF924) (263) ;mRNA; f:14079-15057